MKKFILLITVVVALAASGYGQVDTSSVKINSEYVRNQYLVKAKHQRTAAWFCFGGGVALITTGIISATHKVTDDFTIVASNFFYQAPVHKSSNYTDDGILIYAGVVAMGASIPLFIAAGKNKRHANLMLTVQKTAEGLPLTVAKKLTGLTVSISL
jgi:hypothetical protein